MSELSSPSNPDATTRRWPLSHIALLLLFWMAIYAASLRTPALLDDADATHAQAAQAIAATGDWVTLHVDGVRYLEKAPLPYWISALSLRLFGANAFAIHLPLALAVLALALLASMWSRRAFNSRTALYAALFTLTAAGTFLFTRIFIPDALLSVLLFAALYAALRALDESSRRHAYAFWVLMALAVLTKGLIAIIFLLGAIVLYLIVTRQRRLIARLRPFTGLILFLAIAAPWHILAGLRNTGGIHGHGFFWFYFVNEHFLRFLGRRIPRDYNKLPAALYWAQHIVWLFPWSLFAPAGLWIGYRKHRELQILRELDASGHRLSRGDLRALHSDAMPSALAATFAGRTVVLLLTFSALVAVFFAFSTNQEYYTFPIYAPLLMLLAAALVVYESAPRTTLTLARTITFAHAAFTAIGLAIAAALADALWKSRHLPAASDIGELLAHRNVGNYTLSTSHFFDLTAPSLAALRLPAVLAAIAFTLGPLAAWMFRSRRRHFAATLTVAITGAVVLIAAHIALVRFAPMLSSQNFAARIQQLEGNGSITGPDEVLLYGDQAFGSSLPFYLHRRVLLVDGRTTSMQFGSTFPDAPPVFLTHDQLAASWGSGPRKILFVPPDHREEVAHLLGPRAILLAETSGKALFTDRPLNTPPTETH